MAQPIVGPRVPELLFPAIMAIPLALVIAVIKPALSLPLILGTLVLLVAFLSPVAGLYVLVFSMLLGPEVIVGALGSGATLGRGVTLRFDDLILVLVGVGWLGHMAVSDGVVLHRRLCVCDPRGNPGRPCQTLGRILLHPQVL